MMSRLAVSAPFLFAGMLLLCGCNPNSTSAPGKPTTSATDTKSTTNAEQLHEKPSDRAESHALLFIDALVAGEYDQAVLDFDDAMNASLPPPKLKQAWKSVQAQLGRFKQHRVTRVETTNINDADINVITVSCEFEKSAVDAKIIYTQEGKMKGLSFTPAKPGFVGKEDRWLGELDAKVKKLRLVIHLGKGADGKSMATLDSLDENQKGMALQVLTDENQMLKVESKSLRIVYEGKIDPDAKEMTGEWKQGGEAIPLTFKLIDTESQP